MHAPFLTPSAATVKPVSVWAYFDRVAVWLADPLDRASIANLRAGCDHLHVGKRRARFDGRYRQRLELKQPGSEALRIIAACPDALVNVAEVALDLVFADRNERDDAAAMDTRIE